MDLTGATTADLLAERERLLKYSEDEARDDHGRWTDSGGSGGFADRPYRRSDDAVYRNDIPRPRSIIITHYGRSQSGLGGQDVIRVRQKDSLDEAMSAWEARNPDREIHAWRPWGDRVWKRARYIRLRSGGTARDRALNPIIERLRRELIALADEHGNRVVKYSPDQPRDDHGRWTDGGVSGDAVPVDLGDHTSYRQEDGTLTRWPDLKTAKADFENRHADTKVYLSGNPKPIEYMAAIDQLDKLMEEIPQVQILSVSLRSDIAEGSNRSIWAQCRYSGGASSIELNSEYWRQGTHIGGLYPTDSGFHPNGTSNPAGIMTHEFGHAVQNWLENDTGNAGSAYRDWAHENDDLQRIPVSGYGRTSNKENFAEAFASEYTQGAISSTYGQHIGDLLTSLRPDGWKPEPEEDLEELDE